MLDLGKNAFFWLLYKIEVYFLGRFLSHMRVYYVNILSVSLISESLRSNIHFVCLSILILNTNIEIKKKLIKFLEGSYNLWYIILCKILFRCIALENILYSLFYFFSFFANNKNDNYIILIQKASLLMDVPARV